MWVELHDNLGRPQRLRASRVVIYDDNQTPIALAMDYDRFIITAMPENAVDNVVEFNNLLRTLNIHSTVIVSGLQPRREVQIR